MLLTITTTHYPATDLGYLLHKHPARCQSFTLSFGQAHVFYPEARPERCTVALLLDVDPVGLVRNRQKPAGEDSALEQYVNDRPYVASSFLSVAIAQVFGSALAGKSTERPELAATAMPLHARLAVLPCRARTLRSRLACGSGGEGVLRRLFEPLGYKVTARQHTLDEQFPHWGDSAYFTVELQGQVRLCDLLTHLYVLVPVLDDEKHYWVGDDEVDKLLRHGSAWLTRHPERQQIVQRYLRHQHRLTRQALARLLTEDQPDPDRLAVVHDQEEAAVEAPLSLNQQRLGAVVAALKSSGATRVLDLGCGEGRLLKALLDDRAFENIVGLDVSHRMLEIARERLKLDRLPATQQARLTLMQGALTYRDKRLTGYDAAAVVEVIEHLDPPRLAAFERVLFEFARPGTIVMTTPNAEYNVKFEALPAGTFRHRDHRFEWTRTEFQIWATSVAARFGYTVQFFPVGPQDPALGAPTQLGLFRLSQAW
jgi:3' terminal RNA ribose 2'-O-methyltransferase Hen1